MNFVELGFPGACVLFVAKSVDCSLQIVCYVGKVGQDFGLLSLCVDWNVGEVDDDCHGVFLKLFCLWWRCVERWFCLSICSIFFS